MQSKPPAYQTFLVTMWQERGRTTPCQRYVLEIPSEGERSGFVSREALLAALNLQLADLSAKTQEENQDPQP